MDHQELYLPVETLEHILWLIPDFDDAKERWESEHKSTLLSCALVCKTWMALARRRLLSLYFPEGRVKITSGPGSLIDLVDVFQSPLRTLDPTFIRILYWSGENHKFFFTVLPILDASLFPSLQKLELEGPLFRHSSASPPSSVLSQIKSLIFQPEGDDDVSYKDIFRAIRLCPSVEEITLRAGYLDETDYTPYQKPPPTSLRKLVLDKPGLREMATWLTRCQPAHTAISSLTFWNVSWNYESRGGIQTLLDHVGSNLEEIVFDMYFWGTRGDFVVANPDKIFPQLTKNVRLKRLTIQGPSEVIVEVTPYLLKQAQFAPELEVLNITFRYHYPEGIPDLIKFKLLDEYARSRPSLRQIVVSSTEVRNWREVKSYVRKYMTHCEEKGILEFRQCSMESTML